MNLKYCWTADFETTTDENDCRVWAYSICNIEDPSIFYYGTSINEFFDFVQKYVFFDDVLEWDTESDTE